MSPQLEGYCLKNSVPHRSDPAVAEGHDAMMKKDKIAVMSRFLEWVGNSYSCYSFPVRTKTFLSITENKDGSRAHEGCSELVMLANKPYACPVSSKVPVQDS
jgi:hypothetical protein